jgi:hypothetical protein
MAIKYSKWPYTMPTLSIPKNSAIGIFGIKIYFCPQKGIRSPKFVSRRQNTIYHTQGQLDRKDWILAEVTLFQPRVLTCAWGEQTHCDWEIGFHTEVSGYG